ncbi:MAG: HAD-IA family hydrolase, partial [Planctomycetota bacterium]
RRYPHPMHPEPIEAVLFDSDGTLVDTETISNEVMCDVLGRHGIQVTVEEAVREWSGVDLHEMLRGLQERTRVTLPTDFLDRFRAEQKVALEERTEEIAGAGAMLGDLQLPRAVVSNAPVQKVSLCLRTAGLMHHFDPERIYSAYDVGVWKPAPDVYLHAAASIGVDPRRCAVVEDSVSGVEAGRAAGCRVFAYDAAGHLPDWPDVTRLDALPALLQHL